MSASSSNAQAVESNPHASGLAKLLLESWPTVAAHYPVTEYPEGLSVKQFGRVLGARDFQARPVSASGGKALLPIAKSLAWLARRGLLVVTTDAKGRARYSLPNQQEGTTE